MSTRPVRQSDVSRAFAEHALRGRVEDQKFLVPVRHNYGITHVGQDRLENFVDLRAMRRRCYSEIAGHATGAATPAYFAETQSLFLIYFRSSTVIATHPRTTANTADFVLTSVLNGSISLS